MPPADETSVAPLTQTVQDKVTLLHDSDATVGPGHRGLESTARNDDGAGPSPAAEISAADTTADQ